MDDEERPRFLQPKNFESRKPMAQRMQPMQESSSYKRVNQVPLDSKKQGERPSRMGARGVDTTTNASVSKRVGQEQ